MGISPEFQNFGIFLENQEFVWLAESGGRGRIRTDERTKRADLQSASFSHLDTLPAKDGLNYHFKLELQDDCKKGKNYATCFHFRIESEYKKK